MINPRFDMNTKTCFKCKCEKPLDDFYKHDRMVDGHLNKCKVCAKTDANKHRLDNLESYRQYDKKRSSLPHRVELSKRLQNEWKKSIQKEKKLNQP